jgi:gliding motility-associated-like protein
VEIQGNCGLYRDTVLVELATPPTIDLGSNFTVPFGQTLTLTHSANATGTPAFFWSASGATLNCTACPNPQAELLTPATFSVTLTDANGCTATDELNVGVNETRKIFFPNVFSPNGDGLNDTFFPQAAGNFLIKHLRVYDRWGGMLFEKTDGQVNDPASGWDGTVRGKRVDFGVYLWEAEIEFPDGKTERFGGDVMVAR